jgi:hypothetical protein
MCNVKTLYPLIVYIYPPILIKDYAVLPSIELVKYVIVIKDMRHEVASNRIKSNVCCEFMI